MVSFNIFWGFHFEPALLEIYLQPYMFYCCHQMNLEVAMSGLSFYTTRMYSWKGLRSPAITREMSIAFGLYPSREIQHCNFISQYTNFSHK